MNTQCAAIYARYSSSSQNEQSIEGQLRDCHAYAQREGLTVINEYVDRALTGRSDDRPQFQQMIKDAARKRFSYVIVWKLDRFSRNRFDSAHYKHILKKYGIRVISATENISDSPEGIMMEGMLESLAEYYSANLSKHVKRGQRDTALQGRWPGGSVPYGYSLEDGRFVINPEEAAHVRYYFEQYASGVPSKKIVEDLTTRGAKARNGKPLNTTTFQTIRKNKKYIGVFDHNGIEIDGGCPALIDAETFQRVQKRMEANRRAPGANTAKTEYLLRGKLFCGPCGSSMTGESGRSRSGVVHNYYSCSARKKKNSCKKRNEKKEYLEWYIVEQTTEYVLTPERMEIIADCILEAYNKEFNASGLDDLQKRIDKAEREIEEAVTASIAAPHSMRSRYYQRMEELDAQIRDMELDYEHLLAALGVRFTREQVLNWLKLFCGGDPIDKDFQRKIIDVFINSVYLFDDKVVIYYNMRDSMQVSYIEMLDSLDDFLTIDEHQSPEAVRSLKGVAHHEQVRTIHSGLYGLVFYAKGRFRRSSIANAVPTLHAVKSFRFARILAAKPGH